MLRLFVAVELPEDLRVALRDTMDALRAAGIDRGLRWVRPEGIHVTLKFLGAVDEPRVAPIERALLGATREAAPFDLQPTHAGSFGGRRGLRVVWVGLGGDTAALASLAGRVEDGLAPLGFERERRPFAAHLTLARVRENVAPAEREHLCDVLHRVEGQSFPAFRATHVSLMRSTLGRGGAVYDALASFPLASDHGDTDGTG